MCSAGDEQKKHNGGEIMKTEICVPRVSFVLLPRMPFASRPCSVSRPFQLVHKNLSERRRVWRASGPDAIFRAPYFVRTNFLSARENVSAPRCFFPRFSSFAVRCSSAALGPRPARSGGSHCSSADTILQLPNGADIILTSFVIVAVCHLLAFVSLPNICDPRKGKLILIFYMLFGIVHRAILPSKLLSAPSPSPSSRLISIAPQTAAQRSAPGCRCSKIENAQRKTSALRAHTFRALEHRRN